MDKINSNMKVKELFLSKFACFDEDAIRIIKEEDDIRTPFFRDIDRIIYSLAFVRYYNKTQVFTYKTDDHISKRMTHVQYVSKIARTIGRALGLNEDLIEAASLGHDLGHVPFGHVGEIYLNEISLANNVGYFNHNVHSVRLLKEVENFGKGLNITFQVLDAILCHNGEILNKEYKPKSKNYEDFLNDYEKSYTDKKASLIPATLEGCVVRISDMIAYIGRDIEDGIRMKHISKKNIPENITKILGYTNKDIVNTIVMDIINNSYGKDYIKLSDNIYETLFKLKKFNYENIYLKAYTDEEREDIKKMFYTVFENCLHDLKTKNEKSSIVSSYYNHMSNTYKSCNNDEKIVIDYIAGMTDDYFIKIYQEGAKNGS